MQAFSALYQTLDQTTSTNAKVAAMVGYFSRADPRDAAWAVYFLSGRRLKRLIGAATLRTWLVELAELPEWLVEDTYASVGDLAETIALLLAKPGSPTAHDAPGEAVAIESRSLADWVEQYLLPLRTMPPESQRPIVAEWWQEQHYEQCYIITKLLTGALRVGVSQTLLARALAQQAGLERAVVLHRLMGDWQPDADFFNALVAADDGQVVTSRPYPFCLAAPLEQAPAEALGPLQHWLSEHKWDGIRAQLVCRAGEHYLWSRGEELIGQRFPELIDMAGNIPPGTVLDGEILVWTDAGVQPFSELQRRIGRKSVGRTLMRDAPCVFLAYDLLEHKACDIRTEPMRARRRKLVDLIDQAGDARLRLSEALSGESWADLEALRAGSRERGVEGLMLKAADSAYGTGRQRGLWWKWKIEPYTVDAVMLYAQAGHGRRANLHTDYTFGVWDGQTLVPIAKAYSGLDNKEIATLDKWIRRNTLERFGPVRSVKSEQVFELAFEGINLSSRHKSGIAVRFPRILRWRQDLGIQDADTLDQVKSLIRLGSDEL